VELKASAALEPGLRHLLTARVRMNARFHLVVEMALLGLKQLPVQRKKAPC